MGKRKCDNCGKLCEEKEMFAVPYVEMLTGWEAFGLLCSSKCIKKWLFKQAKKADKAVKEFLKDKKCDLCGAPAEMGGAGTGLEYLCRKCAKSLIESRRFIGG